MNYLNIIFVISSSLAVVQCCTLDAECSISGTTCKEEVCSCEKGFFLNTDSTECLPYVTEYYGECSENAQCEWLGENSECRYVCLCKEGYRWYNGQCIEFSGLGGKCSNDINCYDGYNFQSLRCLDDTCGCNEGYYQRGNTDCRKIASVKEGICALDIDCQVPGVETVCHIGKCLPSSDFPREKESEIIEKTHFLYKVTSDKECRQDEDCQDILNSECYEKTGTCVCKKKYFFGKDGTTCIPELGVDAGCKQDQDCSIKPGKCEDGVCYCRDYYFVQEGNKNCVKTISEKNWNCLSREWCYALGSYSYCASSGTCKCSKIAELDEENTLCNKTTENDDPGMCIDDIECKHIQNGYCIDEVCGCKADYVLQENRCVPDLGAACDDKTVCEITNSECRDGHCACIENYIPEENKACYMARANLGEECDVDIQCSVGVTYSECKNGRCACDDRHLPDNNTCYQKKEFGAYCNNRRECSLSLFETIGDSIVCRNHACQCPTGYALDEDKCSSSSLTLPNYFVIVIAIAWLLKNYSQ